MCLGDKLFFNGQDLGLPLKMFVSTALCLRSSNKETVWKFLIWENEESNLCLPLLYINGQDCFLGTKKYLKGSDLSSPLKIIFFASLRLSVKQEKVRLKFLIWGLTGKVTW